MVDHRKSPLPLRSRILRDATRLMRRHIGATKSIQQGGFAMVDVTQPEQSRDDTRLMWGWVKTLYPWWTPK